MEPKQMVAQSYDQMGDRFTAWVLKSHSPIRARYTALLLERLPDGAHVLELGCGSGIPTTQQLSRRFSVTGVDISENQIALARQNVPSATFRVGDMTQLDLPGGSFDAVVAFFSIFHVPRQEHAGLFQSIARWLRAGGLFVATLGVGSVDGDVVDNWFGWGVPMYLSHFDSATTQGLVEQAGLSIVSANKETEEEDGVPITFLWIVAQKPS